MTAQKSTKFIFSIVGLGIVLSGSASATSDAKLKYGPAGAPRATPLWLSYDYFQTREFNTPASRGKFWALMSYYVPQFNDAACSVASVAMVLNAARAIHLQKELKGDTRGADDAVIQQTDLLEKVSLNHWKARLSPGGYQGSYGVTLEQLGPLTEKSFQEYGLKNTQVAVTSIDSEKKKEIFLAELKAFNQNPRKLMILNFDQKGATDDAQVGHHAPVAAYDEKKQRILILDPDRKYYEPYWISVETAIQAMMTPDPSSKKNRGFLSISF